MQSKRNRTSSAVLLMAAILAIAAAAQADTITVAYEFETPGLGPSLGSLDLSTGAYTPVTSGQSYNDLAYSPAGALYAVDTSGNLGTLALVPPGPHAPPGAQPSYQFTPIAPISDINIYSIAFNSSGALYGTDGASLFTINPSTGTATLIGSLGTAIESLPGRVGGIRFDASGNLVAVAYDDNNTNSLDVSELWNVNPITGTATLLGTPTDSSGNPLINLVPGLVSGTFYGSAFDSVSCGNGCYLENGADTFTLLSDQTATTLASAGDIYIFAANAGTGSGSGGTSPSTVPEPINVLLCGMGLGAVALKCYRQEGRRTGTARQLWGLRRGPRYSFQKFSDRFIA